MRGVIVEVSARKFGVPYECPCCGAAPDTDVRVTSTATRQSLQFPYCKRCVAHATQWEASGIASAGVMVLAIIAAFVLGITTNIWFGVLAFVAAAPLAWWLRQSRRAAAKAACGPSCASSGVALVYLGWSGSSSSFSFESPTFAARFAEQNMEILANVSGQLRKLLDGYRKARLAIPTPAVAAGVAPPPLTARDWIARIEGTNGTVARRVALQRALEMVDEPQPRRELIQTVARIELAPLLDKLTHLSSPAAKRTLLEKSIEQIRADNIADELQDAELKQLSARLTELG